MGKNIVVRCQTNLSTGEVYANRNDLIIWLLQSNQEVNNPDQKAVLKVIIDQLESLR